MPRRFLSVQPAHREAPGAQHPPEWQDHLPPRTVFAGPAQAAAETVSALIYPELSLCHLPNGQG
jgi:hypothetical protein